MDKFWIRLKAPFAAFRLFQFGSYRNTSPTIHPSTAYGLILNLAGIESRGPLNKKVTLQKSNLPKFDIVIGDVNIAKTNVLYQQLHSYPVCSGTGKNLKNLSKGQKYWIAPVYREILTNIDIIIGVKNIDNEIKNKIIYNIKYSGDRYGLPFLGDNNYLIDKLDILENPIEAFWYNKLPENVNEHIKNTCKLSIKIDRENNSKTKSMIYYRNEYKELLPNDNSWTNVG